MAQLKIKYDEEKCLGVQECKLCLKICPESVFMMSPKGGMKKFKTADEADGYELWIIYESTCTGCNWCVNICPTKALSIEEV
ncbi:MAG: 4Fe-4S dicluster domain-containing protein [Promethearchaeota archaeon]